MFNRKTVLTLALMLMLLLTACAGGEANSNTLPETGDDNAAEAPMPEETADEMMDEPTEAAMGDEMMDEPTEAAMGDEMMDEPTEAAMGDEMMDEPTEAAMDDEMMDEPTEVAMGDEMMDEPTEAAMDDEMMDEPTEVAMDDEMMDSPAFFTTELTDISSGETFTIEELHGQVILIQPLAVDCPECLSQQEEIRALHELLGMPDDLASISLDVGAGANAEGLMTFMEENGFDWRFAIAPAALVEELGERFGEDFLDPQSTPILIIDRHGEAHPLPTGIKSAEDLQETIQPFIDDSM